MFSVIIPYFKKRHFIERCINSVISQSYQNFEIIIVDDGSDDNLDDFIRTKFDDRVTVITQKNQGVSVARNVGIANAKNKYIAFLDADDYWSISYLQKNAAVINNENDLAIIGSHYSTNKDDIEYSDNNLQYTSITNYFKNAIRNTVFFTSATVVSRVFFDQQSGFNPKLKIGEDLDVWFRVILAGGNAYFIKNTLVYYSNEDENQATKKKTEPSTSLLFNLPELELNFYSKFKNQEFDKYMSKLKYQGLRYHFFQETTHELSKKILGSRKKSYLLADLYYYLPFSWGNKLNKNLNFRKKSRIYFKFLFRYIYN